LERLEPPPQQERVEQESENRSHREDQELPPLPVDREVEAGGDARHEDDGRDHQEVQGQDLAQERGPLHRFDRARRLGGSPAQNRVRTPCLKTVTWTILIRGTAAASTGTNAPGTLVGDMNQATQSNWKAGIRTTI